MRVVLFGSISVVILIGFMLQLTEIAESTSHKALTFADDMDRAMDCAIAGVNIDVCSPNLKKTDFKQDAREFERINLELIEKATKEQGLSYSDDYPS